MRLNSTDTTLFTIEQSRIENVKEFTHLGSNITENSVAEANVVSRFRQAWQTFRQLKSAWDIRQISRKTKINSNINSVMLQGCET